MKRIWLLLFCFPLLAGASGLEISGLSMEGEGSVSGTVSWENSWYYPDSLPPGNHDGVWLVVKGRRLDDGRWEHVRLLPASTVTAAGMELSVAGDGTGAMLRRSQPGEGHVEALGFELALESVSYGAFRVIGTEMVFVPEGAFYLGDGASVNTFVESSDSTAYHIENEQLIISGSEAGNLWVNGTFPPGGNIPSAFPKGYSSFYVMKYEISQQQYADFLNTLDPVQRSANRLSTVVEAPCFGGDHVDGERNYIVEVDGVFGCDANGNGILSEADDGGEVACNFLTWSNMTAFLDWMALRPMTELEYEKACRGPEMPVALGFAWGTDKVVNTLLPQQLGQTSEHAADSIPQGYGIANYGYCTPSGPMRTGFAAYMSQDRLTSGAAYYGAMEMSGNVWELCVPVNAGGLAFDGRHGDGGIDAAGMANVAHWTTGGHRGGAWNSGILDGFRDLAVSDRFFVYLDPDDLARGTAGGRGVLSGSRIP